MVFDFASETWNTVSLEGAPPSHDRGSAVWTGTEWLVWGGESFGPTEQGGRYDAILKRWSNMSAVGQPSPRIEFAFAWTGSELLVWGGRPHPTVGTTLVLLRDGGAYDPVKDSWRTFNLDGAPTARFRISSVWTGRKWLIWGGESQDARAYFRDGAAYDPIADSWHPMQAIGAPNNPAWGGGVWTGETAFFWGSDGAQNAGDVPGSAGVYNPESDIWNSVPRKDGPHEYSGPALVWSGTHVIALGSREVDDSGGGYRDVPQGRAFSVKDNKWMAMPSGFAARWNPTACWANDKLYLWGGSIDGGDSVNGTVDIWTAPGDSDSGAR